MREVVVFLGVLVRLRLRSFRHAARRGGVLVAEGWGGGVRFVLIIIASYCIIVIHSARCG